MARIEILTEEPSMKALLEIILPKILSDYWVYEGNYFIRPHEGKQDLQKSIPKKIKTFSNHYQNTGIVILHDQDSHDCKILKSKLAEICSTNGNCKVLIRIACKELESWYLGDMQAIEIAYPNFKKERYWKKAKFRNPDTLNAAYEIKKILPEFQKIASAKAIAPHLNIDAEGSQSESYKQFITGIKTFFSKFEDVLIT